MILLFSSSILNVNAANNNQGSWLNVCKTIEWGLTHSCGTYVNSDGSLSREGMRAKKCITSGALLSGAGILSGLLPPFLIIGILEPAAAATGCGNIVDFAKLKSSADPMSFLRVLGVK